MWEGDAIPQVTLSHLCGTCVKDRSSPFVRNHFYTGCGGRIRQVWRYLGSAMGMVVHVIFCIFAICAMILCAAHIHCVTIVYEQQNQALVVVQCHCVDKTDRNIFNGRGRSGAEP